MSECCAFVATLLQPTLPSLWQIKNTCITIGTRLGFRCSCPCHETKSFRGFARGVNFVRLSEQARTHTFPLQQPASSRRGVSSSSTGRTMAAVRTHVQVGFVTPPIVTPPASGSTGKRQAQQQQPSPGATARSLLSELLHTPTAFSADSSEGEDDQLRMAAEDDEHDDASPWSPGSEGSGPVAVPTTCNRHADLSKGRS